MSSDTANDPTPDWPPLSLVERRILGVLIEKAKTTPDVYPLSLNSLVTGCNQKNNRDPLLSLTDAEVEDALEAAAKKGLVSRISGSRVEKWRHLLYETWKADKVELAVLAELLLRGPQTEGELRGRASRMEPIDDLETLRQVVRRLAERKLVFYLGPENRRGTMVTHGFHAPDELPHVRARFADSLGGLNPAPTPSSEEIFEVDKISRAQAPSSNALTELVFLRQSLAELQERLEALTSEFREFKRSLGG